MRILLSSLLAFIFFGCASYPKKNGLRPVQNTEVENSVDSMTYENGLASRPAPLRTMNGSKASFNPYFSDISKDYVYKAKIEAFDKTFGGLFIIKKLGAGHHRIVFTTEMGNTLFDFTFRENDFKVNRILKEMDRKLLINVLKRDFKVLIEEHPPVIQTFSDSQDMVYETKILSKKHYFYRTEGQLDKIVRVGSGKEKVVFLYSEINEEIAGKVQILHKTFPLSITLNII